jgi:anthranilate synthase component 1
MTSDYSQFAELAQTHTLIPVVRTLHADLLTPVSAFLAIAGKEPQSFLLESVERGEHVGRYTFLGARPYMVMTATGDEITIQRGRKKETRRGEILPVVRELLGEYKPAQIPGLPPFLSGAVGYMAYDVVRQFERLPDNAKQDLKLPDCVLMFFNRVLAFDHVRHQIHLVVSADVRGTTPKRAYGNAIRELDRLQNQLISGLRTQRISLEDRATSAPIRPNARTAQPAYERAVKKSKEYIAAGDIFQVVLSQRLDFRPKAEPFEIYRTLRMVNPSPYMYYLRLGPDIHILGSSPEMLVRVTGRNKIEYAPIAGTRWRAESPEEDLRLEQELRSDEKERAEHVMLVDLGRNDVGRVSRYGTVRVTDLMRVERYSHVMHLVSSIEGELREGLDALDAFASCFPAGTLTGAPKVRAMEIIDELEPVRRGVYGGSILYADFAGNLDSCIAIRTMVVNRGKAYVQAGAGIVADSVPRKEFEESMNKAGALVRAAELAGRRK